MVVGLFHFWLCSIFLEKNFLINFFGVELLLEKAMAPHSNTLAWKIPWMEEPDRLQSMGSLRVGHDWATSLSLFTFMFGEGNGSPLQCSCLENPRDGGAWWAAVCRVAQSQTWLKGLSKMRSYWSNSCVLSLFSRVWLFVTPWTVACQAPPSMEFSRQEYWSGLPFPSPGDLPNPRIKPGFLALQADSLPSRP